MYGCMGLTTVPCWTPSNSLYMRLLGQVKTEDTRHLNQPFQSGQQSCQLTAMTTFEIQIDTDQANRKHWRNQSMSFTLAICIGLQAPLKIDYCANTSGGWSPWCE